MRTFVMGDIHGCFKALQQCLERSGFDIHQDKLIQLGDIADGQSEVFECIELLIGIDNLIAIKGNHDEWFLEFIKTGAHPQGWLQGGAATAESYMKAAGRKFKIKLTKTGYKIPIKQQDIPSSHQQFFEKQLLYFIDEENNCFVHAGFDRFSPFKGQLAERYCWDRDLWASALLYEMLKLYDPQAPPFKMVTPFNEIFIGHTSTTNWSIDKPMNAANIHNLDTGAGHDGKLTIMDIHSKQFWQSDPIGTLYTEKRIFTW